MKNPLVVIACLVLFQSVSSQTTRDHRTPKRETKTSTPSVQTAPQAEPILYSQQIVIYDQANFTGQSKAFGIGTFRFNSAAELNDLGSSIKVPNGMVAMVYEHANEAGGYGNYIDLMEDCADLSMYNFNDKVSYLSVFSVTSRPGYVFVRNKMINNQFVEGHWERIKANGTNVDNSPPAIASSLEASTPPATAKPINYSMPVYRIELRIITGDKQGEDTDQEVYVKMNHKDGEYFLDYGPDDFGLGSDRRYDIISPSIRRLSDIADIEIGIKGDDMWGIKRIYLYLNNSPTPVFLQSYESSYRINGAGNFPRSVIFGWKDVRNSGHWNAIPQNTALTVVPDHLPFSMIKSMLESIFGNQLHYMREKKLHWGNTSGVNTVWGDHVEAKVNDNTIHFDLDMEYSIDGFNPEVDVDFDLEFSCSARGGVIVKTANVKVECATLSLFDCQGMLAAISSTIRIFGYDAFVPPSETDEKVFAKYFTLSTSSAKCKGIVVNPNGDIFIH